MKKLSLILAGAVLFGSFAFAAPMVKHVPKVGKNIAVKQDTKTPAAKQTMQPAAAKNGLHATKTTKASSTKQAAKTPAVKATAKPATKAPATKAATTKPAVKKEVKKVPAKKVEGAKATKTK